MQDYKGFSNGDKKEENKGQYVVGNLEKAIERKQATKQEVDFFCAVRMGDVQNVRYLLEEGVDVNAINEEGATALHIIATSKGKEREQIGRILLEWNADVNLKNRRRTTALGEAVFAGNESFVKFLLKNGANVVQEKHIVHMVVSRQKGLGIAKLLLEYGADTDVPSYVKESLLQKAIYSNNLQLLRLLLQHGVQVDETIIESAVKKSLFKAVCIFADYGFIHYRFKIYSDGIGHNGNKSGGEPLINIAVKFGQVELVWKLVTSGETFDWNNHQLAVKNSPQMRKAFLHIWTPRDHHKHAKKVRDAIISVLIIAKREHWMFDKSIMYLLLSYIAYNFVPPRIDHV